MSTQLARRTALALAASAGILLPGRAQCVETANVSISGFHNPFLAGQPLGTHMGPDMVPEHSPYEVPLAFTGQEFVRFGGVNGQVTHAPLVLQQYGTQSLANGPDGNPALIVTTGDAFGISGLRMPANALLGVFLPDTTNAGSAPARLDFSTPSARDFALLQPELFQIFFIGDGYRADGVTVQNFQAPAGAERLFLGSADPSVWNDNGGSFAMSIEHEIADITPYCTAKSSSQGCLPTIGYAGYPTLSGAHPFDVICAEVSPGMRGSLFYGRAPKNDPFQGGTLCTNVLVKRTPIVIAPPTASGAPCSSTFTFDFNAWIQGGNDPGLLPGLKIYAQWWMRDSGTFTKTGLSDALEIQLCQ